MKTNKLMIQSMLETSIEKRQTLSTISDDDLNLVFGFRGQVSVGTPGQALTVLFDTGSTQFWVQSTSCTNCVGTQFDYIKSSSFIDLNKAAKPIRYVDGTAVDAALISETVSINGLTQNNFTMSLAVALNEEMDLDGVMGLGFSREPTIPTFTSQILQTDPSISPVFSYFIDKTDVSGALLIGGIDKSRFSGDLATESILESSFWELTMNSLEIGGSKLELPAGMTSVFDTGSSLGVFSLDMAQYINQKLGIPPASKEGWYAMPCSDGQIPSNLPDLIMTFGSVRLRFTPNEYVYLQANVKKEIFCVSGILGISNLGAEHSIIGNVLLRRYYTVFDVKNRKLGFAVCNREPVRGQPGPESQIIESDLASEIKGVADPASVNGETSSKNTNNAQINSPIALYLVIILVSLNIT